MIVAVLEHLVDDSDELFIVDTELFDLTDVKQKEYVDAVMVSVNSGDPYKTFTHHGVAMSYQSHWRSAKVSLPSIVHFQASIWEGAAK